MTDSAIEDQFYTTSLPCISTKPATHSDPDRKMNQSADLPTRLTQSSYYQKHMKDAEASSSMQNSSNYYTGNLVAFSYPADKGSMTQDAVKIEAINLPFDDQLVVDGYMCPKRCFDKDTGLCTYDRTDHEDNASSGKNISKKSDDSDSKVSTSITDAS